MDIRLIFLNCGVVSMSDIVQRCKRISVISVQGYREVLECKRDASPASCVGVGSRKPLRVNYTVLVPETDTGGRVEYTKAYGRILV